MTSEEKVKMVYPEASYVRGWIYEKDLGTRIGWGVDGEHAWADAWRNLQAAKKEVPHGTTE